MENIAFFLSGIGIGAVTVAIVEHWLTRRAKKEDTKFTERLNAFFGLLSVYAEIAEDWSNHKAKQFALWECKIQLVASKETINILEQLKETGPGTTERKKTQKELISSMRRDLNIS